jgi:biotin carboxyl carrier protein
MVSTLSRPHQRRTETVFTILDGAPAGTTYDGLISLVREKTGKGCSRKLISRWKRERTGETVSEMPTVLEIPTVSETPTVLETIASQKTLRQSSVPGLREADTSPIVPEPFYSPRPDFFRYLTLAVATIITLVGCSYTTAQKTPSTPVTPVTTSYPPYQGGIKGGSSPKKTHSTVPREIKIRLTLTTPADLRVTQRLQTQRQQLELSLKKLQIPFPELTLPSPPPTLNKLPPVSYRQEIAHITLKTGEFQQIETKITQQKQKIAQLLALPSAPLIKGGLRGDPVNVASLPTFVTIDSQPLPPYQGGQGVSVETIIEHERAKLSQMETEWEQAKIQLEIANGQLSTAREKRLQEEYQLAVEENRRAITLRNQQLEVDKQRAVRAAQLQEREYNKAVIRTRIQEIEDALVQLGTVKAPYPGTVKRLKWQGQNDHTLTVELTLDVDSPTGRSSTLSR